MIVNSASVDRRAPYAAAIAFAAVQHSTHATTPQYPSRQLRFSPNRHQAETPFVPAGFRARGIIRQLTATLRALRKKQREITGGVLILRLLGVTRL